MIAPRAVLVIIGILILIASSIPLLQKAEVSISGFSVADKVQDLTPQNTTIYFAVIFVLALIAVIYGIRARKIVIH